MTSTKNVGFDNQSGNSDTDEQASSAYQSFDSRTDGGQSREPADSWSSDHQVNSFDTDSNRCRRNRVPNVSGQAGRYVEPNVSGQAGRYVEPNVGGQDGRYVEPNVGGQDGRYVEPHVSGQDGRYVEPHVCGQAGRYVEPDVRGLAGRFVEPDVRGLAGRFVEPDVRGQVGRYVEPDVRGLAGRYVEPDVREQAGRYVVPDVSEQAGRFRHIPSNWVDRENDQGKRTTDRLDYRSQNHQRGPPDYSQRGSGTWERLRGNLDETANIARGPSKGYQEPYALKQPFQVSRGGSFMSRTSRPHQTHHFQSQHIVSNTQIYQGTQRPEQRVRQSLHAPVNDQFSDTRLIRHTEHDASIEYHRSVVIRTARPIREPFGIESYFKKQFRHHQIIDNMLMDTFEGVVYVTFKDEQDARRACDMSHDPLSTNILDLWIPEKEKFDFLNDCISVHGDYVSHPDFEQELIHVITVKGGYGILQTLQTDCPESMLIQLNKTLSLMDISSLLVAVSLDLDVMVAPVRKCLKMSVQWDQTIMDEPVVLDYIKWNHGGIQITSVDPIPSGIIIGLDNENDLFQIISKEEHVIWGRPLRLEYHYPFLSLETYERNCQNHESHHMRAKELTMGSHHQNAVHGGTRLSHQGYNTDANQVAGDTLDRNDEIFSEVINPRGPLKGSKLGAAPMKIYGSQLDRKVQAFNPRASPSSSENTGGVCSNTSFDSTDKSVNRRNYLSAVASVSDERQPAGTTSNNSRGAMSQNSNDQKEKLEIEVKVNELELLLKTKYIEKLIAEHGDLTLEFEKESGKITIFGSVNTSKLFRYELKERIAKEFVSYDLSRLKVEEMQIFKMAGFAEQINGDFQKNNIAAHMSCVNDNPEILYDKNEDTSRIDSTLCRLIRFYEYKIDPKKIIMYQSKQWTIFLDELKSKDSGLDFSIIKLDQSKPCISLVGSSHMQYTMNEKLKEFENNNSYRNRTVSFDNNSQEYCQRFFISEMQDINEKAKQLGAIIKPIDGAFFLEGLEDGLRHAESHLNVLRDSIKIKRKTLDYPGCTEFLQRGGEDDWLGYIGNKHSCLIKLDEDGELGESTDEDQEDPLSTIAWDHIKNCKITLVKGDPELLKVNRVLNFIKSTSLSNADMPRGLVGGQATWNKIKKDLTGYIGEDLETSGEKNRDLRLHHFVCNSEEKNLREALRLGFNRASTTKCQSIAIALQGIANLELKQEPCVKLLAQAVTSQLKENPSNKFKDVFICGNDEAFLRKVASHLQLKSPHDTTAVPQSTRHHAKPRGKPRMKQQKNASSLKPGSNNQTTPLYRLSVAKDKKKSKLVFTPITVELVSGDILTETTDVMVTSIQKDLNMNLGQVIRTVLQKGGKEIQQELKQKYPNGIATGDFAVSGGGKLPFKRIFHACLPPMTTNKDQIKQLVHQILEQAGQELLTSVAIPALGTANMNYDPATVCKSILSAIEDFAKENQQTSIKSARLVVFTGNSDILKLYGQAMFQYDSPGQSVFPTYSSVARPDSPSKNTNDSFGNISVQLKSADITDQKTTAIVVSVDGSLDLKKGKVAQAILTNGGRTIQSELIQKFPNGLGFFEYAKTTSGNLACQEVYFVCLPHWKQFDEKKMKKLILGVLNDIESSQGTTVSLPAFGTGNLGYPPEKAQEFTIRCLQAFASLNPQYLRTVQIVIHPFDTKIQEVYLQGLHMPIKGASGQASLHLISPEKKQSRGFFKTLIAALTNAIGLSESKPTETTFKVDTVTLTVREGDITDEVCDAFVAAINNNMDLENAGAVCNQISKKCDDDFMKRCQEKASEIKEYGFTSVDVQGGSLKCKEVFFISMDQYSKQWNLGIEKILQTADKKGCKTLALPTFGAAHPDTDIGNLIQQIKEAIISFGSGNPRSLTDIRLIVYDRDILKAVNEQSQGDQEELSQNAHVVYFFTDERKVTCAMDDIMRLCSSRYGENTYESSSIKQFTEAHFKRLVKSGCKNMIKVTYNTDDGIISMTGFGDLAKIQALITDIEKEIQKQLMENLSSDTHIHWQYQKDDKVIDFSDVLNTQLEGDYKGKKLHSVIDMDGETYTVDFEKKVITHKVTGSMMVLIRRDALEAGEPIPKHWEEMSLDEPFKLVSLATDSDEYRKVVANYRYRQAKGNVHGIERVQNRALYQQFIAKKREIDLRNPNNQNEMLLYHGSDFNALNDINKTGFNRSYCGKNATVYGLGVYFAQSSAYSEQYATPDANGMRKLYQARVLVGVSVDTDSDTKYLPKQPGSDMPYDSGKAPASRKECIHVIFHDSQAYPEYIITFSLPVNHVAP